MNFFGSYGFRIPVIDGISGFTFSGTGDGGVIKSINVTATGLHSFGAVLLDTGFCWSASNFIPTITDSHYSTGRFSSTDVASINHITSLSPNTTYYIRAYAVNIAGIAYSNVITLVTATDVSVPNVTLASITSIGRTSAVSGGEVTSDGGAEVTLRGIEWSTDPEFSFLSNWSSDGEGVGSFSSDLILLEPDTTYYVRAFATNIIGTSYSSVDSFTTDVAVTPTVTTDSFAVTDTTAELNATVTNDGDATVTERGFEWSSDIGFTSILGSVTSGSGIGSFQETITGLDSGTTYFWRPYAINSVGTAYGETGVFNTDIGLEVPTVTTDTSVNVGPSFADVAGYVSSDGGSAILARGFVWIRASLGTPSLSSNDGYTDNGAATGNFSATIIDLLPGTEYNLCAYAENAIGVSYGDVVSFETAVPVTFIFTCNDPSSVGSTTAVLSAYLSYDGPETIHLLEIIVEVASSGVQHGALVFGSYINPGDNSGTHSYMSPNTTYRCRGHIQLGAEEYYTDYVTFTTLP